MKIKSLGAVLAKRFGVEAAARAGAVAPDAGRRRLAAALEDYQAAKRATRPSGPSPGPQRPPRTTPALRDHVEAVGGLLVVARRRAPRAAPVVPAQGRPSPCWRDSRAASPRPAAARRGERLASALPPERTSPSASPSSSASRKASQTPSARKGSLWQPASPTSAQPGPYGLRRKLGSWVAPRTRSSRVPARTRSARPGKGRARRAARARGRRARRRARRSARPRRRRTGRRWSGRRRSRAGRAVQLEPLARHSAPVGEVPAGERRRGLRVRGLHALGDARVAPVGPDHEAGCTVTVRRRRACGRGRR